MTTPPLDLPALRKTAEAATEGPWTWNATPVDTASGEGGESCIDAGTIGVTGDVYTDEDAAHIEAFDPPTVLALLARAEAAEKKVAAVRELHAKDDRECAICRDAYGDYVHYPCPTITALDHHTPETETP